MRAARTRLPCHLRVRDGVQDLWVLRRQSNAVEPDVEIPGLCVRADGRAIDQRVGADRRPIAEVHGSFHNDYATNRTCELKLELAVGGIEC